MVARLANGAVPTPWSAGCALVFYMCIGFCRICGRTPQVMTMDRWAPLLAVGAFTLAGCSLFSALLPHDSIDDPDYQFRLEQPAAGWRLLREADIQKIAPDAVAGMTSDDEVFAVVIVESVPQGELEPLARLLIDQAPLEGKQLLAFAALEFQGQPAIRYHLTGRVGEISFRYVNTVFLHEHTLYQVLAGGPQERTAADGSSFAPVWQAFRLLEGPVRGRATPLPVVDATGVGWRVRHGVFESAVYGVRVEPRGAWRVAVGAELGRINKSAEVGLILREPGVHVILIAEQAHIDDRERLRASIESQTAGNLGAPCPQHDSSAHVDGNAVPLRCYADAGDTAIEYLHGVFFHGTHAMQLMAWYQSGQRDVARPALDNAFASLHFIDDSALAALTAELKAAPDPQNRVGPTYALRRGRYRDFGSGFEWRKPEGFWRIAVGDEARATNADATLFIEDPGSGLMALLIVEPVASFTAETFHQVVCGNVFPDVELDPPQAVTLGAAGGLVSEARTEHLGLPLTYRVVTAVHGDSAVQLLIWATPGNMAQMRSRADAIVDGWRFFASPAAPVVAERDSYRDNRMGYALRLPGAPWRFEDLTRAEQGALSSFVRWTRGNLTVLALTMCAVQEGQDEQWFAGLVTDELTRRMRAVVSAQPRRERAMLGGLPATRLVWRGGGDPLDAYLTTRDNTFYALLVLQSGVALDATLDEVTRGFSLVD